MSNKYIQLQGIYPNTTYAEIQQILRNNFGGVNIVYPVQGKAGIALLEFENQTKRDVYLNNIRQRGLIIRGSKILAGTPFEEELNLEPKAPSIQYNHSARVIPFDQVEDISSYVFYIIQVELALQFSTTSTIPVELSIIKMNLKSGELDNFHRIIDPGYIAPCHTDEVTWYSENISGLSPHMNIAEKNYRNLWLSICEFVEFPPSGYIPNSIIPPIIPTFYSKKPSAKTTSLELICRHADFPYYFGEVKPIEEIVWQIFIRKNRQNPLKTSQIENLLSQLVGMQTDKKCQYHRQKDVEKEYVDLLSNPTDRKGYFFFGNLNTISG